MVVTGKVVKLLGIIVKVTGINEKLAGITMKVAGINEKLAGITPIKQKEVQIFELK